MNGGRELERWADVPGWEGLYKVSTLGRVRSLDREVTQGGNGGSVYTRTYKGQVIRQKRKRGYRLVGLNATGRHKTYQVHRLVLSAFVGPANTEVQCRHLDGDPANNRLENLSWGTAKENYADRFAHGTEQRGERSPSAKLNELQVHEIRAVRSPSEATLRLFARKYGVSASTIRAVITRQTWGHLS